MFLAKCCQAAEKLNQSINVNCILFMGPGSINAILHFAVFFFFSYCGDDGASARNCDKCKCRNQSCCCRSNRQFIADGGNVHRFASLQHEMRTQVKKKRKKNKSKTKNNIITTIAHLLAVTM